MTKTDKPRKRHGNTYEQRLSQEKLILEVTESIVEAMLFDNVTRSELSRRLGVSRSHISKALDGGSNLTLRAVADIAAQLGRRPSFTLTKIE